MKRIFLAITMLCSILQPGLSQGSCSTAVPINVTSNFITLNDASSQQNRNPYYYKFTSNSCGRLIVCPEGSGGGSGLAGCSFNDFDNRSSFSDPGCTEYFLREDNTIYLQDVAGTQYTAIRVRFVPQNTSCSSARCFGCDNPLGYSELPDYEALTCDNFDSATEGSITHRSSAWVRWSSDSGDGIITTERAFGGSNGEYTPRSLKIDISTSPTPDIVYKLGNELISTSNPVPLQLGWKMYVPRNRGAYYNIQTSESSFQPGGIYQVRFNTNGTGEVRKGNTIIATFRDYPQNIWFDVIQTFTVVNNTVLVTLVIDGLAIAQWDYGSTRIGGINFFARESNLYYVDRICFNRSSFICGDILPGYSFVCSNGLEFLSLCYYNYGVTKYEPGPCGNTNPCEDAERISCGVTVSSTTEGETNKLGRDDYNCYNRNSLFNAPDKIFEIRKTSNSGRMVFNLFSFGQQDLDLFLLNECGEQINCLFASLDEPLSGGRTQEFIIDVDPPLPAGTYYAVVDGYRQDQVGDFDLTVTCGTLPCESAEEIVCNQTIRSSTSRGDNDVSAYRLNGEYFGGYTGDELLYYFTLDKTQEVSITLDPLSSNDDLALLLFDECDEYECIAASTGDAGDTERLTRTLIAGTYYILVDGFNGDEGTFDLTVAWNCDVTNVCDLGGELIYRGDVFEGTLQSNEVASPLIREANCIENYYNGRELAVPSTLYTDVYVFYNSSQGDFFIDLDAPSDVAYAVFSCDCDEEVEHLQEGFNVNNPRCGQICLGTGDAGDELFFENAAAGFYYIAIFSDEINNYSFAVFPSGPCLQAPEDEIECGQTINSTVIGQGNKYSINGVNNTYPGYVGNRNYSGEDILYKFVLNEPNKVNLRLNATTPMGVFLYDFLCGENLIAYNENSDGGGLAFINDLSLNAGVYYIIVDKAISAGIGNFSLTLECEVDEEFPLFIQGDNIAACPIAADSVHEVTFRDLDNTITIDNNPINSSDEISFHYLSPTPSNSNRILNYEDWTKKWNGQEIKFSLPKDLIGDDQKCSYEEDEEFIIILTTLDGRTERLLKVEGVYNIPNENDGKFMSGGSSLIRNLVQVSGSSPTYMEVKPSTKKDIESSGGIIPIIIETNVNWDVRIKENTHWIKLNINSPSSRNGEGTVFLDIEENNFTIPRVDTVFIEGREVNFRRRVIIEQNGCTQANLSVSQDQMICFGESVTLSASGGSIYNWSTGATSNQITVSPTSTTPYTVSTIVDGCTDIKTINVTVLSAPAAPVSNGDRSVCLGDQLPALSVDVNNGESVYWYDSPVGGNLLRSNSAFYIPSSAGTYYAETRLSGCRSSVRTPVRLNVSSLPSVSLGADKSICQGENITLVAMADGGGGNFNFNWSDNLGTGNTKVVSPISDELFTVTVTDGNGCSATDRIFVEVNEVPTISGDENLELCAGESTIISVSTMGGTPQYSYHWNGGLGEGNDQEVSPAIDTEYIVTVTDDNGCTDTKAILVQVNPLPALNILDSSCSQDLQSFSVQGTSNADSISSSLGNFQFTNNGSFEVSNIASDMSLSIVASFTETGCSSSIDNIGAPEECGCPDITAPVSTGDQSICQGDQIPKLSVSVSENQIVDWYDADGNILLRNSTDYTPEAAGTYFAEARSGINGCISASRTPVVFEINPLPTVNASQDMTVCEGENVILTAEATGGTESYVFSWNNNLGNGHQQFVRIDSTISFEVLLTDSKGCTDKDEVTIIANPRPIVSLGDDIDICLGDSALIEVDVRGGSGPYGYNWNNGLGAGGTSRIVSPTETTTYNILVTDSTFCSTTDEIVVSVNPTLNANILQIEDALCYGEASGNIQLEISGGVSPYEFLWQDNTISDNLNNLLAGDYEITVSDQIGCQDVINFQITEPEPISIDSSIIHPTLDNDDGSIKVNITGSNAPYKYTWLLDGVIVGDMDSVWNLSEGEYILEITDANGCIMIAHFELVMNESTNIESELNAGEFITLFPNPTNGKVFASFNLNQPREINIYMYNLLGELLIYSKLGSVIEGNTEIDLNDYPTGMYLIKFEIDENIVARKVIKN